MITTVYSARRIITMNPNRPFASHVAVRDGRILGAGSLEELKGWGEVELDTRFADKVILPGFVEGHSHAFEGGVWKFPYVGYFDRTSPDGKVAPGLKSIAEVVAALQAHEKTLPKGTSLLAWGFDPIYFGGRRMVLADVDRISADRPVVIIHSNFHVANANTAVLAKAGITRTTNVHGIVKDAGGEPTGELQEMAAKYMAYRAAGVEIAAVLSDEQAVWRFAKVAQLAGVTTATDLHNELPDSTVEGYLKATASEDFPLRLLPAFAATSIAPAEGVPRLQALVKKKNNDKLRFQLVKIVTDGSIQGLSARMRWPGYYDGTPNGVWNVGPDDIDRILLAYHRAGFQVHIHTNGDEASEVGIEAVERALATAPRWDHRHTLQHAQMADAGQFRRMKALGMCANLFANHLYYWGDIHYARTLGPERAERMDACATALATGVPFAIHCDAPVTPIGPLFTAWCAVNRLTASGRTLGEAEKIPVADALRAITLGAAYTLKLDEELGSIDVGKRADFAILDDDPLSVPPEKLKDVGVWGTVLGGRIFEAPRG